MWIYKITNIQNNKVYIGQTIKPIEQRFQNHISSSLNGRLDSHLARAIRKYGKENFKIEIIDVAQDQDELSRKEQYWIRYYNSVENGYNETDTGFKCGGNTYQSKTDEEMEVIKNKIRTTKIGGQNPMARKIKRTNIITGEEDVYDTIISCAQACGIRSGKTSISERLSGRRQAPLNGIWIFEYYNE